MGGFETMFGKGALPALERTVRFTSLRHRVIANNIANANTPHYLSQDLPVDEFQRLMRVSLDRQQRQHVPVFEFASSFDIAEADNGGMTVSRLVFPNTGVLKHDENNVSVDLEMAKLSRNALLQDSLTQLLRHQFDLIETAIRERLT